MIGVIALGWMTLVPKYADEVGEDSGTITIDPVQVQNTGVVSVAATQGDISRSLRTVATGLSV